MVASRTGASRLSRRISAPFFEFVGLPIVARLLIGERADLGVGAPQASRDPGDVASTPISGWLAQR
jgi:hypothetical protein